MKRLTLVIILLWYLKCVLAEESFEITFQSSGKWSANEWVEFRGYIPPLKEFTTCHWEKLSFFGTKSSHIWSYCFVQSRNETGISCVQLYSQGDVKSSFRNIVYSLWVTKGIVNKAMDIPFPVESFQHRTWNHICFVYSSITKTTALYYNGKLTGTKNHSSLPIIPGSEAVDEYSFIFGQEPDSIRGDYSYHQALFGSIAEFNLWNISIEKSEINDMATLNSFPSGNVISWQKQHFKWQDVKVSDIKDRSNFFKKKKMLVIFPKQEFLNTANETCSSYGGSIVTPESEMENEEVLNILLEHRQLCLPEISSDIEVGAWVGLVTLESGWARYNEQHELVQHNSYSNWTGSNWEHSVQGMCVRMRKDGSWNAERKKNCKHLRLCTICSLTKTPIFSLKGLCEKGTQFQWHYYPNINSSYQIDRYDGYKRFQMISVQDNSWRGIINGGDRIILNGSNDLVGRNEWEWLEKSCTRASAMRNLTFSNCEIGKQFTCNSGGCIAIRKRCNNVQECNDGSDEEECTTIDIPQSYDKLEPPELGKKEPLPVHIDIVIENINQIESKHMMIDISMKITMSWKDCRLKFRNLPKTRDKLIKSEISKKLWLPSDHLMHMNAIIGQTKEDPYIELAVRANSSPLPSDIYLHREELIYSGAHTSMNITKRVRIKTTCNFQFIKFPFDKQECQFIMYLSGSDSRKVDLVGTEHAVRYIGGQIVGQFKITHNPLSGTIQYPINSSSNNAFKFTIELERSRGNGIVQIIIPSLILWMVACLTLQENVEDVANRNRTSVTALLVLVTLFGAISNRDDFPKTTGFKYIDAWFLWYLTNIFVIICHHVVLSNVSAILHVGSMFAKVDPLQSMEENIVEPSQQETKVKKKKIINRVMNVFLLVSMLSFNVFYFVVAT